MTLSKTSESGTGELQWRGVEVHVHQDHHWHCSNCSCHLNITDKCPRQNLRPYYCRILIIVTAVAILPIVSSSVVFVSIWMRSESLDHGTDILSSDSADTRYSASETRLFEVSGFFKEQVGMSVIHYANATLYLMKQSPPLTEKHSFSVNTTVTYYDDFSSYSHSCWHYYLHQKSNVTLRASVSTYNCDPYHVYIVKGSQNYANWINSLRSEESSSPQFVLAEICYYGLPKLMNYTVEEEDHYYFCYYSTGQCYRGDQAGNLSLYVEKFEYSISKVQVGGECNTYKFDSCSLNLPLQVGAVSTLIATGGQSGDKYDITFTSTNRKWPIPTIVISCALCLLCTKVIITCWLCHCKRKRKQRQYVPL